MKTPLTRLALASLLAAGAAHAAPFTGKGIPADAGALVHIDAEAAGNSTIFKTLREIAEDSSAKNGGQNEKIKKLMAELGITESDVKDATAVIGAPKSGDKEPAIALHLRGKFDRKKLLAIPAKHPEVKANKLGAHTWYSVADLDKAFGSKATPAKDAKGCVCPVNDGTLLFATDTAVLANNLKAIDAGTAYADAGAKAALAGASMISGYFPEAFLNAAKAADPAPAKSGAPAPKSLAFSVSETGGDLKIHSDARMSDEQEAKKLQAQLAMYQGLAPVMFGQSQPGETAAQAADKDFLMSAVNAVKFTSAGDTFTVDFAYPAEKLAAKLREKKADIAAMAAQQASGAGGTTAAPVAKRAARKAPATPVAAE